MGHTRLISRFYMYGSMGTLFPIKNSLAGDCHINSPEAGE